VKLIHVTDLHLCSPGQRVAGLDPTASLASAIDDINHNHPDADLVVFTGDLSDDGSEASYRALEAEIDRLVPPVRLLLGNHDDRTAFRSVFASAPSDDGFVQSFMDTSLGRLVFLDTLDEGAVGGRLCARRLAWLDRRLEETSRSVIVFMHHPPFDIGMPTLDGCKLADPDTFADVVRRRGNVRAIAAGHVHRLCSGVWNGIAFSTGRSTNHQTAPLFGATDFALSAEKAAYNVMLVSPSSLVVHVQEIGE
jgi:3',5'-cyclic-AMP phosphodiesterase